jgi:hypothetical protein
MRTDVDGNPMRSVLAPRINSREQSVTGKVSAIQWGPVTSFTLKIPADSDFVKLTGLRSLLVYQVSGTQIRHVTLINGATVHIVGLLFEDAGTLKMVAKRISEP